MLHFKRPEDPVFTAILFKAFDEMEQWYEDETDPSRWRWRVRYPRIAAYVEPEMAMEWMWQLYDAAISPGLCELTEPQWLLVHDALQFYCALHNDHIKNAPNHTGSVKPYFIGEIDFEKLVEMYFFNTDFLFRELPPLRDASWLIPRDITMEVENTPRYVPRYPLPSIGE